MITGIKINNIRNLDFDDYLQLAPMTILLGKNSSGKSTFLRTFPLIKQTLGIKRSTPLLWYGNLVDFGSFDDTINKFSSEKTIKIGLEIQNKLPIRLLNLNKTNIIENNVKILSEISITKKNEIEFISKIEIIRNNLKFILNLNEKQELESIILNETIVDDLNLKYDLLSQELIPTEFYTKNSKNEIYNYLKKERFQQKILKKIIEILEIENEKFKEDIYHKISEYTINYFRRNMEDLDPLYRRFSNSQTIGFFEQNIAFNDDNNFVKKIKKISPKYLNAIQFSPEKIKTLKNLVLMLELPIMFEHINLELFHYFNNISYIAPLRATAQRYYRIQGLDVENIDSTGSNLPIYLKNLNWSNRIEFSKWTEENFGFKLTLISNTGHISLAIQKGNETINLTDTGFGFSQILPILLQVWSQIFNKDARRISWRQYGLIFLIEQPELHLHPAMQATLIDIFIKAINLGRRKGINIKFILETHSETIVNRVGRHIIEENYKQNDAKIFIFNNQENKVELQETFYNSDGDIEKWPLGFFGAEDIIL